MKNKCLWTLGSLFISLPLLAHSATPAPSFPFIEEAFELGLDYGHHQRSDMLSAMNETLGAGICVFDYNNDGWMDIFIVGGSGQTRYYGKKAWWEPAQTNALFKNDQGRGFINVTKSAGLALSFWGMGCATGDLDNDGDDELFVTAIGQNYLFNNNHSDNPKNKDTFTDITESSGINKHGGTNEPGSTPSQFWSTSVAIADMDKDGLLDIYVGNFISFDKGARTFEGLKGFETTMPPTFNPFLYNAQPNFFYRNDSYKNNNATKKNLSFSESAQALGIDNTAGRTLSVQWIDMNHDTFPDLLVINSAGSPSQLFINQQGKSFVEASKQYHLNTSQGAYTVSVGDVDQNGAEDLIVNTPVGQPPIELRQTLEGTTKDFAWESGLASDQALGLARWGNHLVDLNNDGFLDLVSTNGLLVPHPDAPYISQGQRKQIFINNMGLNTQGEQKSLAASLSSSSQADWLAVTLTPQLGISSPMPGRAVVAMDFDNDGDTDLVWTNNNHLLQVFENTLNEPGNPATNKKTEANWLGLTLRDKSGKQNPADTHITVVTDNNESRYYHADTRNGFLSQSDPRYLIGLGQHTLKQVTIQWPDGQQQIIDGKKLSLNHYQQIEQVSGKITAFTYDVKPKFVGMKTDIGKSTHYLLWLLQTADKITHDAQKRHRVVQGYQRASVAEKLAMLEMARLHITADATPFSLPLARAALRETNPTFQIAGIRLVQQLEYEPAVYWLTELLEHSKTSPDVLCQIADTFTFFYHEEEAVTQLKKLGVQPLVKLLDHPNDQVKLCAMRALGEAENYRAVQPLEHIAQARTASVNKAGLQKAAIEALGLIREKESITVLTKILKNPETPADNKMAALIALKRLDAPNIDAQQLLEAQNHLLEKSPDPIARAEEASISENTPLSYENFLSALQSDDKNTTLADSKSFAHLSGLLQQQYWLRLLNEKNRKTAHEDSFLAATHWKNLPAQEHLLKQLLADPVMQQDVALYQAMQTLALPKTIIGNLWSLFKNTGLPLESRLAIGDILIRTQPSDVLRFAETGK